MCYTDRPISCIEAVLPKAVKEPEISPRNNIRQCGKKNESSTCEIEAGVSDGEKDADPPQFKVPQRPQRRCRPLQVVQGNIKVNKQEQSSRRRRHQQGDSEGAMAKMQKSDAKGTNSKGKYQEQYSRVKANLSSMKLSSSKPSEERRSIQSSHDASRDCTDCRMRETCNIKSQKKSLPSSAYDSRQTRHKKLPIPRQNVDLESVRSGNSDVVSVADSAVSSLGVHLRHSIKPDRNHSKHCALPSSKSVLTP